jgi:tetratricopeptide (TPR) repeat protein
VAIAIAVLAISAACSLDRAEREYRTALAGEETGMGRRAQIAHLDRAIEIAPKRAWYYETRAIYWIDLKEYARARADMDRVIELGDRPYARFLRGLTACEAGDIPASLPDFDRAIAGQPDNSQFYRGRSLARSATGNASGALEDAERLVWMSPQMAQSYYARGVAKTKLGRNQEAVADFDHAHRIGPELVYVLDARADALERLGDVARAADDRRDAEEKRQHGTYALCLDPFRY